ncbi:MAG: FAD-binding oxidoreductase [Thermoplasmata archaeon]|nr:MAG: FAD-binding oxidoreductase [Thermoplasmata archaeon]
MTKENADYNAVFKKLTKILGNENVKKQPKSQQEILVKPKTTDDVSRIVKLAVKGNIPIFSKTKTRKAREKSKNLSIVLSIEEMNGVFDIDDENLAVTVGPGVKWMDLIKILSNREFSIGVYPSVGKPTVGEWVNIGGAGTGSYKFGPAEDQVRTMEVVLPDGKMINTGFKNVLANSSGYNLNGLFIGADGTLGVITKVTLKMYPKPEDVRYLSYIFIGIKDFADAMNELKKLKTTPLNISFFDQNHPKSLSLVGKKIPDLNGTVINITLAGFKSILGHEEKNIEGVMQKFNAKKVASKIAQKLWDERFFDVIPKPKKIVPTFCETLIPISSLHDMINETHALLVKMNLKGAIIGTLADRSTISFTPYFVTETVSKSSKLKATFMEKIGDLALNKGGRPVNSSIFLLSDFKRVYGEGINTILDIKSAIDPHDIMNPYG